MKKEQLTQLIEELSVDYVLIDPTDTDELRMLLSRFQNMVSWAKTFSQPVFEYALNHIIQTLNRELDTHGSLSQDVFDLIDESITVIQRNARHEFDFSRAKFPFPIDTPSPPSDAPAPESLPKPPTASQPLATKQTDEQSDSQNGNMSEVSGLRHPESLPSHLDMELFAEYLSLQPSILDKMESLILTIEQNHDIQSLDELKRMLHTQKGEAGFLNLKDVERLSHVTEDMLEANPTEPHTDLLFSVIDWIRHAYRWYKGESDTGPEPVTSLLNAMAAPDDKTPPLKTPAAVETDPPVTSAPDKVIAKDQASPRTDKPTSSRIKDSILVDTERLDRIIDMIGELVIAESMVLQSEEIKQVKSQELSRHLAQMDKFTRGLQEAGLSLRMVPIRSTFQKIARLVRDISKKSGKPIQCFMQGEDTELDKTIVDKIGEPLLHIIRNAADHGIEDRVEHRTNAGKPETGTIHVRASHKSGNIQIEIEDDGRGLDKDKILSKARQLNLIPKDNGLTDREIINMIFEPGFSTSKEVTDLSGRGVGMSVVKTTIEGLRGGVEVYTIKGKGSRFTIRIPLTLAIIDGMIVRTGKDRFIIPTLSIITSHKIDPERITSVVKEGHMVDIQGRLIPLFSLSNLLNPHKPKSNGVPPLMVVVEGNSRRVALGVDELIGKQQIVIKSLGESMKNIPGISGAAIMSDGRVGLIVDVDKITTA